MRVLLSLLVYLASLIGLYAQINSVQDGDWDNPNTWDCACVPDVNSFDEIIANHQITITNDINLALITITSGSIVTINPGVTVSIEDDFVNFDQTFIIDNGGTLINNGTLDLGNFLFFTVFEVNGTLTSSSTITLFDPSLLLFNNGSLYRHAFTSGGDIPIATWNSNSTVEIIGLTGSPTVPLNLNQSFGNFVWNTPSLTSGTLSLGGQLTDINGDLIFVSSGSKQIRLASGGSGYNMTIGGDFVVQGGIIFLAFGLTSPTTITVGSASVGGDFNMSGGLVNLGASQSQNVSLDLFGSFTKSGGNIAVGSTSGERRIRFIGNGVDQNYSVDALSASALLSIIVEPGAVLNLGTSAIVTTGTSGSFTSNGTVKLGSLNPAGALQGNIPITTRNFNSGARIVYEGSGAQFIGSAHPSTSGVITEINNSSGATLVADVSIGGNLLLTAGNLSIASQTLTLNGGFTPNTNFLNVSSASNISIGGTGAFGTLRTTGSTTINNITLNRVSGGTVTLGSNLTIGGTFTQTQGDIILNGQTLTISGPYSRANGSFSIDAASNITIDGSGSLPTEIAFSGSQVLNTLVINRSSSTVGTSSSFTVTNLNLLSGTFDNSGTITMATGGVLTRTEGSIINNTPQAVTSFDIVYNVATNISTGSEIPSLNTELRHVTKTGSATVTLTQPITINGDLTLSNGIFDAGVHAIDMKGNMIANSTSVLTSNTMTFSGTSTISGGAIVRFGNLTITGSVTPSTNIRIDGNLVNNGTLVTGSGAQTFTFGGNTTISGSSTSSFNHVTISGILTAPTGNFNVAGNWTNNGTFNRGGSTNTITFNGTTSIAGSNPTTFSGVIISGTLNSPATLTLAGNWTNNGTFNRGTGTVVFAGSSVQNIQGSVVTDFNNITVTNNANPFSVRVQSNQNLRGILTLSSNTIFDADGSTNNSIFTLVSTDDEPTVSDAAIALIPAGAQVSGNVTVQRFMSIEGGSNSPAFNNGRIYRYISSPVSAPAVSQIQVFNPITGSFTGTSTCSGCLTNQSMFQYNESVITDTNGSGTPDLNDGYEDFPVSANSETLSTGRGYAMFVWGNVPPVSTAGNATWAVRNPINSGTINFVATAGVSFTAGNGLANDGWNLVGNPYPSTIDWDAATGWTRTGLNDAIYMKDNGASAGTYATYINGIGANGGSQFIPIGQAFWVKSDGGPVTFQATEEVKSPGSTTAFFRTSAPSDMLRIALRKDSRRDETVIYFQDQASEEFDGQFDAYKLKNDFFNLSTVTPMGDKLAINGLPVLDCSRTLGLDIANVTAGMYRLDFTEFESFILPVNISLKDNLTGALVDVKASPLYEFQVTSDEASFKGRFEVTIMDMSIQPDILVTSTEGGVSCKAGSVTLSAEGAPAGGAYRWYENEDDVISISGQSSNQFVTPELDKSKTYYVSALNAAGCEGARVPVIAEVVNFDDVEVNDPGNGTLVSTYESGNQWYKDGQIIPGATNQTYSPDASGTYRVEVTIEGCTTSAERVFTVTDVDDESFEGVFIAYPNPVESILTVELRTPDVVSTQVVDLLGRRMGKIDMVQSARGYIGTFDFKDHPAGIYLLQVTHKDGRLMNKRISKK